MNTHNTDTSKENAKTKEVLHTQGEFFWNGDCLMVNIAEFGSRIILECKKPFIPKTTEKRFIIQAVNEHEALTEEAAKQKRMSDRAHEELKRLTEERQRLIDSNRELLAMLEEIKMYLHGPIKDFGLDNDIENAINNAQKIQ